MNEADKTATLVRELVTGFQTAISVARESREVSELPMLAAVGVAQSVVTDIERGRITYQYAIARLSAEGGRA